jgi:hypothetical protein
MQKQIWGPYIQCGYSKERIHIQNMTREHRHNQPLKETPDPNVGPHAAAGTAFALTFKADSHIACRAHAVPLPCRAAKGLECVFPI